MNFFLRHSIGFFLQVFFAALLCLVPFQKESYRYSIKRILTIVTAGIILFSSLFPIALKSSLNIFSEMTVFGNIYMLLVIFIFISFYFWIVLEPVIKKILVVFLVVFYSSTQYMVVNQFFPLFPNEQMTELYEPPMFFLYFITTAIFFPVAGLLMKRTLRDYFQEIEPKNIQKEFKTILMFTLLYFTMMFLFSFTSVLHWWLIGPPFLLVACVLTTFYWFLFRESIRRKREDDYRRQAEIQQMQYQKIIHEIDNTRRMRHDMRHHFRVLYNAVEQGNTKEVKEYLSGIIEQSGKQENERFCKNMILNGVLQYYIDWARSEDIVCDVLVDCEELAVSTGDLTILFGNILENAINACVQVEENRWIKVKAGTIGGSFAAIIDNSCNYVSLSEKYYLDDGYLPAWAFRSVRTSGLGLRSISVTAEKYGGNATFCFDKEMRRFSSRFILTDFEKNTTVKAK